MSMKSIVFFCLILMCLSSRSILVTAQLNTTDQGSSAPNSSYIGLLERHLFSSNPGQGRYYYYDNYVRPSLFSTLEIHAHFYLIAVSEVNEKEGVINPMGSLVLYWTDDRLTWKPEEFGNIKNLTFNQYKVWTPRFVHNGLKFLAQGYRSVAVVNVDYHGTVTLVMAVNEAVPCQFDMTDFPRDTQTCNMHLIQMQAGVKFISGSSGIVMMDDRYTASSPHNIAWNILNVTLITEQLVQSGDTSDFLTIGIVMERHSNYFVRIYVAPVCFILLLIPVIFLLPPDSTEKLTYGAILLFSMITVTQTVEAIYPPYTSKMPYLIQLTTASGALLFVCILMTSIISSAERIGRKRSLPLFIKRYIVGVVGPLLLVKENEDALTHGTVHIKPSSESDTTYIVQSEQSIDFSSDAQHNGSSKGDSAHSNADTTQALQALVSELKQSRLQSKAYDDWTNFFTILNRFLFLLSLLIGIIIMLCFG